MSGVLEKVIKEERAEEFVQLVDNLMKNLNLSVEEACQGVNRSVNDYYRAKELIKELEN